MIKTTGAVALHKRHCKDLIRNSEQEAYVRLPVDRVSSAVNPLFGDLTRENDVSGETVGPFKCIWYDAFSAKSLNQTTGLEAERNLLMGQYKTATAFAEFWLDDVLIDQGEPLGKTWFSKAKHIVFLNQLYEPLGEARLGLATVAPYILMIVLKGGTGYDERSSV